MKTALAHACLLRRDRCWDRSGVLVSWRSSGVLLLADPQRDLGEAGEAERARAGWCHVDDTPPNERPAVVDRHDHGTSVLLVGHMHLGAERQGAMGCGQCPWVQ